jgi:hypothetical protein
MAMSRARTGASESSEPATERTTGASLSLRRSAICEIPIASRPV